MGFLTGLKSQFDNSFKQKSFSKEIPYPIYSEKGNQLTSINGEESYCYELIPGDLEQLKKSEILDVYSSLCQVLNNLDESTWLKFYRWNNDKIFLATNSSDIQLPNIKKTDLMHPRKSFFNEVDPFSDINFFENYLTVNTEYWRLVHVQKPPMNSYESFLDDFDCDYMLAVNKIGRDRAKHELLQKRRSQGVTLDTTHQNHEGEASYNEANELLKAVATEGEGLFKVNIWFVVKAESFEELNSKTKLLISSLRQNSAKVFIETKGLDYFFNHLLMGVRPSTMKAAKSNAAYLANLIPNTRDFLHQKGLEVFAMNGKSLLLDIYDQFASNQNWLITGGSGEGKSFLAASLMQHLYEVENVKIGVFDLGGSLKRMALYLGGVNLSAKINPLQFQCPHYLKRFILSVLGKNTLSKQEEGQLFSLIEQGLLEQNEDFKQLIEFISKDLAGIKYFFSELWEYFTHEIIAVPEVFYLDTENKPEALIAPYLIFAKELSENQEGRVVNFYDECWDIFDKCPEIIRSTAKISRKKLIGNIFLTQEIVELTQNHGDVANAIIGNTYGKIYFYQADLNHPVLSAFEKDKLKQVKSKKGEYSEFLFSSPDYKKVVRLYVDHGIYELCHSEKEQLKVQSEFINKFSNILSYRDAMNKWIGFLYD